MKLTIDLDPDTAIKLRAMAQAQGRSVEELVVEVLREHASEYKRLRLPGFGKYDSGETDISERAEEILTEAAKRGGWH